MPTTAAPAVRRVEVRPIDPASDAAARRAAEAAAALGLSPTAVATARVYLIEADLDDETLAAITDRLLADPVSERADAGPGVEGITVEVHPLPGVMDPAAGTVRDAIRDLFGVEATVSTGTRYDLAGLDQAEARRLAASALANPVVSAIHDGPFHPDALPHGTPAAFRLVTVPLRELDDAALEKLSRDAHLFLDLAEMRAVREHYRALGREPTDIELETLAQTWSEHCVHKTLKSRIRYAAAGDADRRDPIDWAGRPGHTLHPDGSVTIDNLLRSTIAAATHELTADDPGGLGAWCLSVFVDNAGIVGFDDEHAVCVKVETHNHPSAIEPYGGAATGIGGCIRDIIGTGLAAKPIASTDVFCVAAPDIAEVPPGCLHPRRVLSEVVAGVRDYGNRMGIPTVNGAVWFDDRHIGNPLVFCGCVGVMPRTRTGGTAGEGTGGETGGGPRNGDLIVALGGRTGRDGIHGATFSSAELTDTHADEFGHAVQIGNAIEEKRVLDAILRARDHEPCLFSAITDCGAGGFSSAVGEMGETLGAEVDLDRAPLKYAGLTYTEIWISEAQERMVLAVPPGNLDALRRICDEEHVELAVLGRFGTPRRELILHYHSTEVGRLPMAFLHDGIPTPERDAAWTTAGQQPLLPLGGAGVPPVSLSSPTPAHHAPPAVKDALLALLAHPNIASKHDIIRQYDHEVQGNTVVKPLGGPLQRGPMDAAVITPVPGSDRGLAIACGLATNIGDPALGGDPYLMALAAADECVRNLVCVGARPDRIAILDNFCWPSCKKPGNLAALVRAAEGCYDAAKAYKTPFVSGKDSLNNQFTIPAKSGTPERTIEIPPTQQITGIGLVDDTRRCVTMDAKAPGRTLVHIEPTRVRIGGHPAAYTEALAAVGASHYAARFGIPQGCAADIPSADPAACAALARTIADLLASGLAESAHDVSDGGLLCAAAEMLIAGSTPDAPVGLSIPTPIGAHGPAAGVGYWFGERPGGYLVECRDPAAVFGFLHARHDPGEIGANLVGRLDDSGLLRFAEADAPEPAAVPVEDLAAAWLNTVRA